LFAWGERGFYVDCLAFSVDFPQAVVGGGVTDGDEAALFEAMGDGAAIFSFAQPVGEASLGSILEHLEGDGVSVEFVED
jgi:hypothetical protein